MNSHDGGAASQQQEVEEEEEEEDDVLPLPAEDGVAAKCQHNGWASSQQLYPIVFFCLGWSPWLHFAGKSEIAMKFYSQLLLNINWWPTNYCHQ